MLTSSKSIRADYRAAGAMHELFAPCAFIGESVVMTKRQDVFAVLRLRGLDPECLTPDEIERVCIRFDAALRTLGTEYRVYQYLVKRRASPVEAATEERSAFLNARSLYEIELYLVILRTRPVMQSAARSLLSRFSMRSMLAVNVHDLRREAAALATALDSVAAQLEDTLAPEALDRAGTLAFLRSLVHCGTQIPAGSPTEYHVDQQIAVSDLECWRTHLRQGERYVQVLSLAEIPAHTSAHMLGGLLALPCEFTACSEWQAKSNAEARAAIEAKRDHYNFSVTSIKAAIAAALFTRVGEPREQGLKDESMLGLIGELGQALCELETGGHHFGQFSLTLGLHDTELTAVQYAASKAIELFAGYDAKLIPERYNMLNAWLAMIPGNSARNFRQMWLLNTCYADLSFLFAPSCGERWNAHLAAPALNVVETRAATPYHLNLHVQDVAHTLVLGATGSGKSFLVNFLVDSYEQYGARVTIFDLGGSYHALTAKHGGGYLRIAQPGACRINPFYLPDTLENREFQFSFVRVLVERDGYLMSVEERKDLAQVIGDLYGYPAECRTLATLARTGKASWAKRLAEWVWDGRLAGYFDHAEDTLTLSRFQAFDFEGMDNPEVLEPLLFYVLHRASAAMREQARTPKLFVFDEAWRFFRNPVTRAYIHEALKTWRKRNGAVVMATQSSDDLHKSELLPVIVESCATQIFTALPALDVATYRDTFHLNAVEAERIAGLLPKREFLLRQGGASAVLALNVEAASAAVYGNREVANVV